MDVLGRGLAAAAQPNPRPNGSIHLAYPHPSWPPAMPVPNLTAQVLDRFAELARASGQADQEVVDRITGAVRANPALGRHQILEIAKAAMEGANGPPS